MKENEKERLILSSILFKGIEGRKAALLAHELAFEEEHYQKGEKIVQARKGLGLLIEGKLKVGGKNDERKAIINELTPGSMFGFASLYDEEETFESDLWAKNSVTILWIKEEALEKLFAADLGTARNVIAQQSAKIRFLNERIRAFTAPDASAKLLSYLQTIPQDEDGVILLPIGMAELAKRSDIGRASLYRAFDKLENEGKIEKIGAKRYKISFDLKNHKERRTVQNEKNS